MGPKGTDIALVCTEKQVKIFISTLWVVFHCVELLFSRRTNLFLYRLLFYQVLFSFFLLNHHFFLRTARPIQGQRNHPLGRMLESQ